MHNQNIGILTMHDENITSSKVLSQQQTLLRNFTHITIPAEIWLRRDISIQAKALWAELRSLHCKKYGGCYASIEYLEEFMGLQKRRIFDLFKELKDAGLMEVVSFNGRVTIRKAIVPPVEYTETVSAQQVCTKPHTSDSSCAEKCTPSMQDPALPSYIENKEDNKDKREEASPPPSPKRLSFGKYVKLTKEEYKKFCLDHGKNEIDLMIETMNDWIPNNKNFKDYAAALRNWFKKPFNKKNESQKKNPYQIDKRTKNMDGTVAENPYEGLF
jgi:hypothetical protein